MPNPYVNKVTVNNATIIDLTSDTAIASDVAAGKYFHLATGERVAGTASGGDVSLRELICPQQTVTPSSYEVSLEREEGFVIGGHYVVTYDGTEYLFTAGSLWGGNGICLGEQTLNYDHSARADEIAPFLLWETFNDVTRTPKLYAKDNNSHAIKVERIDRDSVETTNICPQQTVTTNSSYIGTLANTTAQLVVGDYYLVTYDGTEWMFTAASLFNGETVSVGDDAVRYDHVADDNIYPFWIYNDGAGMKFYALDASASHTVKVDHITEIPDSIALTTKTITSNGTYRAMDDNANGYSSVTVSVPTGGSTDFIVTLSYNDQTEMWEPDCTYAEMYAAYTDGKTLVAKTDTGFPASLQIIDDPSFLCLYQVQDNYSDASTGTYGLDSLMFNWRANGISLQNEYPTYDAYDATTVPSDVANGKVFYNSSGRQVGTASGSTPSLQAKTATPSTSQQVITADSGYDGLSQVTVSAMSSGTAGTPTATKGTVSNHVISVTPSVTNTTGYITGGTKTGTAVTVSASELVSGNKAITQNGSNIDVADYATVSVNVSGSSMNVQTAQSTTRVANTAYTKTASLTCSKSGTYDVYWDCFRSSTSGTSGSQLHVGGSAYGSANTTFSNHAQNNHLTGVTISANQEVAVYVRSRNTSYYAYCGQLTIVQTA